MIAADDLPVAILPAPRADLRAVPGQFFLAVPSDLEPYLPRVVFPFRMREGAVESLILPSEARAWPSAGALELRGPYGHGFVPPSHNTRALVLTQDLLDGAHLIALVEALIAHECEVAVLGAPNQWMERWLPPEVEYRASRDLLHAAAELWDWADNVYACGERSFYGHLRAAAQQARLKFERGWAQILVRDLPMPCGIGICYVCACKTARGVVLNCRDGPVMDLADWISHD